MPLRWSADGKALYVQKGWRPLQIFRVDAATGARTLVREVAPTDAAGAANMGTIVMTADASTVVYSHHRVLSDLYLVTAPRLVGRSAAVSGAAVRPPRRRSAAPAARPRPRR